MSAVLKGPRRELRPMRETDLSQVMAIERRVYPYCWTEGIFSDCMRVGYCCWVLEEEQAVVGYGVMSVGAGEAHILNLSVQPESQGQGLGRQLLDYLLELAKERGADTAFLEVRPTNTVALRLYESVGFHQVGTRRAYYPAKGGREDALILGRGL